LRLQTIEAAREELEGRVKRRLSLGEVPVNRLLARLVSHTPDVEDIAGMMGIVLELSAKIGRDLFRPGRARAAAAQKPTPPI
jgi:hypothetical protein